MSSIVTLLTLYFAFGDGQHHIRQHSILQRFSAAKAGPVACGPAPFRPHLSRPLRSVLVPKQHRRD